MTWYLPAGETVIPTSLRPLIARAILHMLSELDLAKDMEFQVPVFDGLTMDQKLVALYKIAFGLMDPKTHAVEHTAALEGGIAALFNLMAEYIDCEMTDNPNKKLWRGMVQTACQSLYNETIPWNANYEEWRFNLDTLDEEILWDNDWSLDSHCNKKQMGIMPDYFRTAPRFPNPDKIQSIKEKLIQFCEDILAE